jgi:hypothetical protein
MPSDRPAEHHAGGTTTPLPSVQHVAARHSSAFGIVRQDERYRSPGLARRRPRPHRRLAAEPTSRTAAVELESRARNRKVTLTAVYAGCLLWIGVSTVSITPAFTARRLQINWTSRRLASSEPSMYFCVVERSLWPSSCWTSSSKSD